MKSGLARLPRSRRRPYFNLFLFCVYMNKRASQASEISMFFAETSANGLVNFSYKHEASESALQAGQTQFLKHSCALNN